MEMWLVWLIVAGAMFLLEIMTAGFLVMWFGISALFTMGISFFAPENILLQTIFFLISSTALIVLTKPLVKKFIQKNDLEPSNVYTVLGKKALVTTEIDPLKGTGQIKIDSDVWAARSENEEVIPVGSKVEILKVEGVKVIVKKVY